MKILSITLENIRSYTFQEITFPSGSILLSGDVGSGKSSILLALDFALFGLRTGSLSGSSLLRNGTSKGSVELHFEIDHVPVVIKRHLRRTGTSVSQEPGYLILHNAHYDLSPLELKDRVLHLLHYPKEFLTKNRSLIYLYTVYTPQEEMKHILLSDTESRLEILRKVFGIDKYKRIKDNAKIFVSYLKGRRKELAGRIADLSEKQDMYTEKEHLTRDLHKQIQVFDQEIRTLISLLKKEEEAYLLVQERVKEFHALKNTLDITYLHLMHKKQRKEEISLQFLALQENISKFEKEIQEIPHVDPSLLQENEAAIHSLNLSLREKNAKLGALHNRMHTAEETQKNIQTFDICPLCKQQVTKHHVQEVIRTEQIKCEQIRKEINLLMNEIAMTEERVLSLTQDVQNLRKSLALLDSLTVKKTYSEEKKLLLHTLQQELRHLEDEITQLTQEERTLQEKIHLMKDVEVVLEQHVRKKEEHFEQQKNLELQKNTVETQLHALEIQLKELAREIQKKLEDKQELLRWTSLQDWIEHTFVEMMGVIEKHILSKVHTDFNHFFQKWFSLLIEEDYINIRLDEEFSPLIEQNGHIIDYSYLSGGEKTAAALAYRLALNQVINLLMSVIKTRDLLILDEPTDGFSENQIDHMRTILKELGLGQVIIVSHESKIETFVDHVIHVRKDHHITEITSP